MTTTGGSHGNGGGRRPRAAGNGSFLVDESGTVLGFDEGMEALTGWPAVEVVGRTRPPVLGGAAGDDRILALLSAPPAGGADASGEVPSRLETRLGCRDGRWVDVEVQVTRLPGSGRRMTVTVLRVLTLSGAPGESVVVGGRDEMTGLLDRASFGTLLDEAVEDAARAARPLAVVLADVDHLRRVNDRFGRPAGDEVILRLAGILRASVDDDRRLSRLGDDGFAILLPDAGRGEARQFAARLRSTVERFHFLGTRRAESSVRVTLSLGAASFPADAEDGLDLLARAREALGEARALGRNRVWCYLRRPRVPLRAPVYFDGPKPLLVGFTRDLSPSGVFVETPVPIEIGMRCALSFPLPTADGNVHVIGRVVRTVPPCSPLGPGDLRAPGMGVEFERFGPEDRHAIDGFLHQNEAMTLRPETGALSF